jgi:hypothetical protein
MKRTGKMSLIRVAERVRNLRDGDAAIFQQLDGGNKSLACYQFPKASFVIGKTPLKRPRMQIANLCHEI